MHLCFKLAKLKVHLHIKLYQCVFVALPSEITLNSVFRGHGKFYASFTRPILKCILQLISFACLFENARDCDFEQKYFSGT